MKRLLRKRQGRHFTFSKVNTEKSHVELNFFDLCGIIIKDEGRRNVIRSDLKAEETGCSIVTINYGSY